MFENLSLFQTAYGLARHAGARQATIAMNIANADTPNFRARGVDDFATSFARTNGGMRSTRSGHLGAGQDARISTFERANEAAPNGNTVSLEEEMVASVTAQKEHSRAMAIYRHGLTLMRAPLGRR